MFGGCSGSGANEPLVERARRRPSGTADAITAATTTLPLVRRRSVQLRDRHVEEAQVHRQLTAVMHEVVDGVAQGVLPAGRIEHLVAGAHSPGAVEVGVLRRR